jgi:hypothetical protein
MSKPARREEESLKRLAVLLILISVVLMGCGSKPSVVGTWKVVPESVKSAMIDASSDQAMASQIKSALASARFHFKDDGVVTMSSTMGSQSQSGKWSSKGETIEVQMDVGGPQPTFTLNSDGSKLHMVQGGQMSVEMDLVRAE